MSCWTCSLAIGNGCYPAGFLGPSIAPWASDDNTVLHHLALINPMQASSRPLGSSVLAALLGAAHSRLHSAGHPHIYRRTFRCWSRLLSLRC